MIDSGAFDPGAVPLLRDWRVEAGGSGIMSYLDQGGSFAHAFSALWLSSPELIEIRGCVLIRERYRPANFEHWWTQVDGNTRLIEELLNRIHMYDLFMGQDASEESLGQFAQRLGELWRCTLPPQFPDRRFDVYVTGEPESYGPTLSFATFPRK